MHSAFLILNQKKHLTGLRNGLRRDIWHMFHLHSDIKIAEGLSNRKPLGYVCAIQFIEVNLPVPAFLLCLFHNCLVSIYFIASDSN